MRALIRLIRYIRWRLNPPETGTYKGNITFGTDSQANWSIDLKPETVEYGEVTLAHQVSKTKAWEYSYTYKRPLRPGLKTMAANGKGIWWEQKRFADIQMTFSYSDIDTLAGYGYLIWEDGAIRTRFNFAMPRINK